MTCMLLCELIDEVCVDAAERAKLEGKQVCKCQLHPLLLLRAIWERGGWEDGREAQAQDARLCVERLQLCERRAPQLATHWYRMALFFLDLFSIYIGLLSSSSL